jgi:hypothetical protein
MFITEEAIAIMVAGLMVGVELCISAFVHPRLRGLEDRAHATAAKALAGALGAAMPFWYAATLLLTAAAAWGLRHAGPAPFRLACVSAGLWLASIIYSIPEVRINAQIAAWDLEHLPGNWKTLRLTWDRLHAVRVVILTVALACLVIACLSKKG